GLEPATRSRFGVKPGPSVFVAVRTPGTVFGLDSPTGKSAWRGDGPGRLMALSAGSEPGDLPTALYHSTKENTTACRQAWPFVLPAEGAPGQYTPPAAAPIVYPPPPDDPWLTVPLPWEHRARKRLGEALLPALACLILVGYFVVRKRWWVAVG